MITLILALTLHLNNIQTITYPSGYQVIEADMNNIPVFIGSDQYIYIFHVNTNK